MKTKIYQLPIELCETLLSVVQEIPPNAQLYWARNKEVLLKVLNKVEGFEPLTISEAESYLLPETRPTKRGILWRKRFIGRHQAGEFIEKISKIYPAQPASLISAYHINVDMYPEELFTEMEISSVDDLAPIAFQYPQITSLLAHHKKEHENQKGAIVGYKGSNYFPLLLPTGTVEFMSFCSRRPWMEHAGWKGWFMGPAPHFKKGKLLFKKAEV